MALKLKDMVEFTDQLRFHNGRNITLDSVQRVLQEGADYFGIPVAFNRDILKAGFLGGDKDECLVLYNPEHPKDYYHFCVTLSHQGSVAFIDTYYYGYSKIDARAVNDMRWQQHQNQLDSDSGLEAMAGLIGGAVSGVNKIIGKFTKNEKKEKDEVNYYTIISDLFNKLVEVQYDGIKTGFFGTT